METPLYIEFGFSGSAAEMSRVTCEIVERSKVRTLCWRRGRRVGLVTSAVNYSTPYAVESAIGTHFCHAHLCMG